MKVNWSLGKGNTVVTIIPGKGFILYILAATRAAVGTTDQRDLIRHRRRTGTLREAEERKERKEILSSWRTVSVYIGVYR